MVSNDELRSLCDEAIRAGAVLHVKMDEEARRTEGREIIETVAVLKGVSGIGPHPMSAIFAAERLREAKAKGLLEPVIVSAEVGPMPRPLPEGMRDPLPSVTVKLADGGQVRLFSYYPDEISFEPGEFVGLKLAEARHLRFKKDQQYLLDKTPDRPRGG